MRERVAELVETVSGWANVNSGSHHPAGVTRMAKLLAVKLEEFCPEVSLLPFSPYEEIADDGRRVCHSLGSGVCARCRPEAPVQILLNGHLDTVFGPENPFQRVRREGSRLIGPGVADMKGGLLVMVESLRILEAAPFRDRAGWKVLLNPDEEIGSPGSVGLLRETASGFQAGLVFEPALPDGNLVGSRMGTGNFLVRVEGRTAHAGREFPRGRNAVVALAELIVECHGLNRKPGVIVNVGRVAGGSPALNIVPAQAACRLNVRVKTPEEAVAIEESIRNLVKKVNDKEGFQARVDGGFGRPPKPLTPATEALLQEIRTCGRELGIALDWAPTGGGSDGNILAAAGLPTVDSLGVRGGGIHTGEEFLEIPSLVERIGLCSLFLLKVARGDIELPV